MNVRIFVASPAVMNSVMNFALILGESVNIVIPIFYCSLPFLPIAQFLIDFRPQGMNVMVAGAAENWA